MLKGKKIILGITGSIAAYKACYIIRGLIRQGAEVQVVITPGGKRIYYSHYSIGLDQQTGHQ